MNTTVSQSGKHFAGAGYLIGLTIIIITAIIEIVLSEDTFMSILSLPFGITMGMILEQKFQGKQYPVSRKMKILLFSFLFFGIIVFASILLNY